jgi:hypothetical protein
LHTSGCVDAWSCPTWVVSWRRVLEAVFILLEPLSPSRRILSAPIHSPPSGLPFQSFSGIARISSGGDATSFFLTSAHRCSCPRRPSWNPVEGVGVSLSPRPLLSPLPCTPSSGRSSGAASQLSGQSASSMVRPTRASPQFGLPPWSERAEATTGRK